MMARKPQPAERSLLLDFIGPVLPVSLVKSLRISGAHAVAVAISGVMLLKLVTVLSTGLFVLQPTHVQRPAHDIFAFDDFKDVNYSSLTIDRRAFARVYGASNYSLPYPSGTTSLYAFQGFNATARKRPCS